MRVTGIYLRPRRKFHAIMQRIYYDRIIIRDTCKILSSRGPLYSHPIHIGLFTIPNFHLKFFLTLLNCRFPLSHLISVFRCG